MNDDEKVLSPHESLRLIESMINNAKNRFSEDGSLYLIWGWFVFFCSFAQFILLHFYQYPRHYMVWIASWIVLAYHIYYIRKKKSKEKVRTYTDHIIAYVWITFAIIFFLISFLLGRLMQGDFYIFITPIILVVYGMPVFLSGIILRFKPLIIGGLSCWVLSIATTFITEYDYRFLMIPAAMIVAWIIPGYSLRKKYKQQALKNITEAPQEV